jgi:hypothetical protein
MWCVCVTIVAMEEKQYVTFSLLAWMYVAVNNINELCYLENSTMNFPCIVFYLTNIRIAVNNDKY